MSALRILFFLGGSRVKASSRLRGFWVAEELIRQGAICPILYGKKIQTFWQALTRLPDVDFVYFQKRYSTWDYAFLKLAERLGKRTLFDLDDAPFGLSRSDDTEQAIIRMMTHASAVVVGSRKLLAYARQHQKHSFLIPSSIKMEAYPLVTRSPSDLPACLGWIGHGGVYHHDVITILRDPLCEVAARYKVRLKLIGTCQQQDFLQAFADIPGLETVLIDNLDWTNQTAIHREMTEFDIGLYPLLDNEYNSYKSGFKALEYMALELPLITSPVGANAYIVNDGIDGFHANSKEEWTRALSALIEDPQLRLNMGKAGRQKTETEYTIPVAANNLTCTLETIRKKDMVLT